MTPHPSSFLISDFRSAITLVIRRGASGLRGIIRRGKVSPDSGLEGQERSDLSRDATAAANSASQD